MKKQKKARKIWSEEMLRNMRLSRKFKSTNWLKKTAKQFCNQVHELRIRFVVISPGKTFWFRGMMHVNLYEDSLRLERKLSRFYRKFREHVKSRIKHLNSLMNSCSEFKLRFKYSVLLHELKLAKKKFKGIRNKARQTRGWIYDLVLQYAREMQCEFYDIRCREDFEDADFLRRVFDWVGFIEFNHILPIDDIKEMKAEAERRGWDSIFVTTKHRLSPPLSPTSEIAAALHGVGISDHEQVSSSESDDPAHVQRWDSVRTRFGL